jgi:glycosyltransferase involved in cell wall biosynthesis
MNTRNGAQPRVLYVETYPAGSHGRVLDLLLRHSTLHIDDVRCGREHWRWLAIAAQYEIRDELLRRALAPPDLILCSGPLNLSALVALLPAGWDTIPRIVYFHESQWTYPSEDYDPRPYVLAHLDAVAVADEAWFNSRYHLETFWSAATSPTAPRRVRELARRLQPTLEHKCRVVYPPVEIGGSASESPAQRQGQRLLWNARWELDKRPASFVQMLDLLADTGHDFDVLVLGTGSVDPRTVVRDLAA